VGEGIEESELRSGMRKRKDGECEEDIRPVGGKSEEAADLKKYIKMLQNSVSGIGNKLINSPF